MDIRMQKILACPLCKNEFSFSEHELVCSNRHSFNISQGIINLLPEKMAKLSGEKQLAELMEQEPKTEKDKFSLLEWGKSKQEFWEKIYNFSFEFASKNKRKASFINIGCGLDGNFKKLEEDGCFFVNFDLVESNLIKLKKTFGSDNCLAGDVNNLPFINNSFDCLICADLMHHESERAAELISDFYRILKPGGVIFLEDVNALGLFQFYKSIFLPKFIYKNLRNLCHKFSGSSHNPAPYEFPTNPKAISSLIKAAGFSQIKFYQLYSLPNCGRIKYAIYKFLAKNKRISLMHNFHYFVSAIKP